MIRRIRSRWLTEVCGTMGDAETMEVTEWVTSKPTDAPFNGGSVMMLGGVL